MDYKKEKKELVTNCDHLQSLKFRSTLPLQNKVLGSFLS